MDGKRHSMEIGSWRSGVAILISDTVDFKTKTPTRINGDIS